MNEIKPLALIPFKGFTSGIDVLLGILKPFSVRPDFIQIGEISYLCLDRWAYGVAKRIICLVFSKYHLTLF